MGKTITSTGKPFENKNGEAFIYDAEGKTIGLFSGKIQEVCGFLFLISEGKLYDIVENEDGSLSSKPYQGYSLI